ncbi:MAG TPA: GtrA family protein [Methyloceanibacter sp.]|nr:GtrA family protein [Methyloceanibacter sp.]
MLVHLAVLYALLSVGDLTFATAQLVAALCAMTFNFALNNITTYRTARLVGRHFVTGLLIFTVICGAGLLANVGIASFLFRSGEQWWVAGLIGALVGSVWNYAMSRLFVWGRH